MAVLVGALGSSHAPSIAFAHDAGHHDKPEWKPFFDAYAPVRAWLSEQRVDTIVMVYNDHLNHFQFAQYPTFALGVADHMAMADEGAGPRSFPPVPGHPALGWHLAQQLVTDEFDPTICQELTLDHGVMSVLPLLTSPPWSIRLVPIHVNVLREPMPTPRRLWKLGQSIGRAVQNFEGDARVVVASTGGLSHQLHGDSFGFVNPDWDQRFMDLLLAEPELLAQATHADYIQRGGTEGVEMMMWLAMRGALAQAGPAFTPVQRFYWGPMLTGYGLLALQAQGVAPATQAATPETTGA